MSHFLYFRPRNLLFDLCKRCPFKVHLNFLKKNMKKALYVEDDNNLASTIIHVLNHLNIDVQHFRSGESALIYFVKSKPDMILLDIKLEGKLDGFDVARIIRSKSHAPILFITSHDKTNVINKILKFNNFDYIHKPFTLNEFRLRIHKMLNIIVASSEFKIGNFIFYPGQQMLFIHGNYFHLNMTENLVLKLLCEHMHEFIGKCFIAKEVWKEEDFKIRDASLLNIISRLRKALKPDPSVIIQSNMKFKIRITVNQYTT